MKDRILNTLGIGKIYKKSKELSEIQKKYIEEYIIKNIVVGKELFNREKSMIKMLVTISSTRGNRHKKGYPVRGQRTKTNANTSRRRIKMK